MPKRIYPPELHTFVAEHASGTNDRDLTELINARFGNGYMTEAQVKAYRTNHHLPSGLPKGRGTYFSKTFPEPIVRYIMVNHVGIGPTEMADKLNEEFGTGYTASQLNGYYSNHHLNSGLTGRFEKGHVPANKGKHPPTVGRMAETQFKKGHLPHNTKPIGYERINKDGYAWTIRRTCPAYVETDIHDNLFSAAGTRARGAKITIRTDSRLTLHEAMRWNGRFLFLTSIELSEQRDRQELQAAVCESVTLTAKPQDRTGRDALNRPTAVEVPGFTFPGVLTEKYFRNDAEDVYRAELQQRVLVTPKVIVLRAGDLVQQDTEPLYTVRQVLDLDPYKNEYVIERRWDA